MAGGQAQTGRRRPEKDRFGRTGIVRRSGARSSGRPAVGHLDQQESLLGRKPAVEIRGGKYARQIRSGLGAAHKIAEQCDPDLVTSFHPLEILPDGFRLRGERLQPVFLPHPQRRQPGLSGLRCRPGQFVELRADLIEQLPADDPIRGQAFDLVRPQFVAASQHRVTAIERLAVEGRGRIAPGRRCRIRPGFARTGGGEGT